MIRIIFAVMLVLTLHAFGQDEAELKWRNIQQLTRGSGLRQNNLETLIALENEADAFWQRYADSPHVWETKLILLQTRLERAQLEKKTPDLRVVEADAREIADATAAPPTVRADAAYIIFDANATAATESHDAKRLPALDTMAADFLRQFPKSDQAEQIPFVRMGLYTQLDPGRAETLLKTYATDKNPNVTQEATRRLSVLNLTKKPLDLKFTAVDGKEFDLAKLRGKVVLVDFWATWCGPCRMEIPNVVATYKKLHDKGFEIVGISLDSNKDKLVSYAKEKEMTWPQYFDGQSWQNKISSAYGITGIPTMWLVDKKGLVRLTNARDNLEGNITKLLAE